jgi:hypothetical protein
MKLGDASSPLFVSRLVESKRATDCRTRHCVVAWMWWRTRLRDGAASRASALAAVGALRSLAVSGGNFLDECARFARERKGCTMQSVFFDQTRDFALARELLAFD